MGVINGGEVEVEVLKAGVIKGGGPEGWGFLTVGQ